jgi:hypothetical protein
VSIPLACACGRRFRIKDELAGKRILCPECKAIIAVPAAAAEEPIDLPAYVVSEEPRQESANYDPDEPRPLYRAGSTSPSKAAPPKKKRKKRPWDESEPRRSRSSSDKGWLGGTNAGLFGGLAMVIIAIVWFVVGLSLNIIFFYPPILLIIGLIAMGKGLFDRS